MKRLGAALWERQSDGKKWNLGALWGSDLVIYCLFNSGGKGRLDYILGIFLPEELYS
jgi:hypothetical protein